MNAEKCKLGEKNKMYQTNSDNDTNYVNEVIIEDKYLFIETLSLLQVIKIH